jgi:hypothetical protein
MFDVEIDTGDIERAWREAVEELARGVVRGVVRGVAEGARAALSTGGWRDRTGETRRRTTGTVETTARNGAAGEIASLVPHASFLDQGTAPHEIRPRTRRALRWEDGGGEHFATRVQHPGTAPTGYMGEAYQKAERVIVREVEVGVARAQSILDRY